MARIRTLLVLGTFTLIVLLSHCKSNTAPGPALGDGTCGSVSGTATLHTSSGTFTVPASICLTYETGASEVEFAFCAQNAAETQKVCAEVALAVSDQASSVPASFPLEPWAWDDPMFGDGNTQLFDAQLTEGDAYVYAYDPNGGTGATSTDYPGSGGGTVTVSNATFPYDVGDSGQAHIEGTNLPLSGGATLSFSLDFGVSISEAAGASGSSTGGSTGSTSSGGGACNTATCDTYQSDCQSSSSDPNSQAYCYCAAACIDQAGIDDPADCCNAGQQAACLSQLESDCHQQMASVTSLNSGPTAACNFTCSP